MKTVYSTLALLFFIFILPSPSFAAATRFFDTAPPTGTNYSTVAASYCGDPSECWNSERVGVTGCGTACAGGSAWTKYELTCIYDSIDRDYTSYYQQGGVVYSTADKCDGGQNPPASPEPYLRGGNCGGTIGGTYKTCCTNTSPSYIISDPKSGMGSAKSCLAVTPYSGAPYPPYDGVCPAGSIGKFCGFTDTKGTVYPACGQAACGTIPGASPSPSPSPTTCTPGEYDERCTASACSAGSADCASEIYQCNASGTGWDYQYPQCNPDKCGSTCSGTSPPPPPPPSGDNPPPPPPGCNNTCKVNGIKNSL